MENELTQSLSWKVTKRCHCKPPFRALYAISGFETVGVPLFLFQPHPPTVLAQRSTRSTMVTKTLDNIYNHSKWAIENIQLPDPPLDCSSRTTFRGALAKDVDESEAILQRISILEEEYHVNQTHVAQKKAWLAPIRAVPPEILGEIFLEVCASKVAVLRVYVCRLTEVCTLWRKVAISIPQLWSEITLWSFASERWPVMGATTLQLWLSRVKHAPLSLTCNPACLDLHQHQIISPHGANIKSLNLKMSVDGFSSLSRAQAQFFESVFLPSLEQLSVESRLVDPITFEAKNLHLTYSTPRIKKESRPSYSRS